MKFNFDKLIKIILVIAALVVAFSLFYYYVIFLPQKEQFQIELQEQEQLFQEQQAEKKRQSEERIIELKNQEKATQLYLLNDCLDEASGLFLHLSNTSLTPCLNEAELLIEKFNKYRDTMIFSNEAVNHLESIEKEVGSKVEICDFIQNDIDEKVKTWKEECFKKYPQ